MKQKLIRLTTISDSFHALKGQLNFLNQHYEVIGVASGKEKLKNIEEIEGVRTINVNLERQISIKKDIISLFLLVKIFRKEKPFIVHANTPKGSLLAMIAAWIAQVPHRIYTVTGLRFETATGKFRFLLITMERITCWCATKVIPEGDGVKQTLIASKITNKPLWKILNGNISGIDLVYYKINTQILEQANSIKNNFKGFTFCFVGRLVKDKGINELIRAFKKLDQGLLSVRLLLVGSFERKLDPLLYETEQEIVQNPNILFMDWQEDVRHFFVASDAFVFPSYREGFPNAVLQAGAMELPSIVTDINGCNEIIVENVNGKIIPPQNEEALYEMMKYFVDHRYDTIKDMAQNARPMIVNRFEQKKVWEALLKEYQSLV